MTSEEQRAQKLAASLTANSIELLPYLPYLLQDLWELGGDPDAAVTLLEMAGLPRGARVLDLACGKGAVGVRLAQRLNVQVTGIDLLPEFIDEAIVKAREHGVSGLCSFAVGDAARAAELERGYDCVVLCAAGDILGPPRETLEKLRATVRVGGYILLDESYLKEPQAEIRHEANYYTEARWLEDFAALGLFEVARRVAGDAPLSAHNEGDLASIAQRVEELCAQYPDKAPLFRGYLNSQKDEVQDIENSLVNLTWLLLKMPGDGEPE